MSSKVIPLIYCVFGFGSLYAAKYQYTKKKQNEKRVSSLHQRVSSEPIECPTKLSSDELNHEYKYRPVTIKGMIDTSNTIIMGRHKAPESIPYFKILNPNSFGGYVYSPLQTESGQTIIVNRGWVPKHKLKQYTQDSSKENTEKQENVETYQGIISNRDLAAFFESYSKQNTSNINRSIWQFKGAHDIKKQRKKDIDYVVVDLLKPENKMGQYPHRLTQDDIYGMIDISQQQRIIYSLSLIMTGILCIGYSYYLVRTPRGIQKINTAQLLYHYLR